jgi:hypothetical protein
MISLFSELNNVFLQRSIKFIENNFMLSEMGSAQSNPSNFWMRVPIKDKKKNTAL